MAKFPALTPGINSQTASAEFRNQMLSAFRGVDSRMLVTPGIVFTKTTLATNVDATETTLMTIPITSDYFAKFGSSIIIFACGSFAANANNKTLRFKLNTTAGDNTLFTVGPTAFNNVGWTAQWEIIRSGVASEITWLQFFSNGTSPVIGSTPSPTVDLSSGGLNIVITGQATTSADISLYYAKAQLLTT